MILDQECPPLILEYEANYSTQTHVGTYEEKTKPVSDIIHEDVAPCRSVTICCRGTALVNLRV